MASPSDILSMSDALMTGNRSFGRFEERSLVLETRSMKALTISSLDGVAITAQKWYEAQARGGNVSDNGWHTRYDGVENV